MDLFCGSAIRRIKEAQGIIKSIDSNLKFQKSEDELNDCLLALIHSVGDIADRIYESGNGKIKLLSEDDKVFLLAFVYLNNQLKHDTHLNIIYCEVQGSMFPINFSKSMHFGQPIVCWANFEDHGRKNARGRRKHYDAVLNSKNVYDSLNRLGLIIKAVE